jgi:hypothetical protein
LIAFASLAACGREGPPLADAVELNCHPDGSTTLTTPIVHTHPDGVHLRIRNMTGESVSLAGLAYLGDARPGTTDGVVAAAPGDVRVACYPYSRHGGPEPPGRQLQIRDVGRYWVDPELECAPGTLILGGVADYGVPRNGVLRGEQGSPVDLARRHRSVKPGDIVELAGYPEASHPIVRVVRRGRTVQTLFFSPAEGGGLLSSSEEGCTNQRPKLPPKPSKLECTGLLEQKTILDGVGNKGRYKTRMDAARAQANRRLKAYDRLDEEGDYAVVARRQGRVIAVISAPEQPAGGFDVSWLEACADDAK